jgi:hypothetical protein
MGKELVAQFEMFIKTAVISLREWRNVKNELI